MPAYLRDGTAKTILHVPHRDRSCRSNTVFRPVTVYWHRANQSQRCQVPSRVVSGVLILKPLVWLQLEKDPLGKAETEPRSAALETDTLPQGQWGSWLVRNTTVFVMSKNVVEVLYQAAVLHQFSRVCYLIKRPKHSQNTRHQWLP